MIKIATVCGMGFGTSMMLAMQIRRILAEENIAATVDPVDLGSFKSMAADVVVTTRDMGSQLRGTRAAVVLIDNLIDNQEIGTKLLDAVRSLQDEG